MILSGKQIIKEVELGRIHIEPFSVSNINPNSYNYHLGKTLIHVKRLDVDHCNIAECETIVIPPEGYVIMPGELYLGNTVEQIGSEYYTTSLIGRSSMGRLGLFLQISANLGHQTVFHNWTLEIRSCVPLRVFADQVIGQVSFWETVGDEKPYIGYYARHNAPTPSKGIEEA